MAATKNDETGSEETTTAAATTTTPREDEPARYRPSEPSDFDTYNYSSNPTVFGNILRGELPTRLLTETKHLVAFRDIAPRAPLHALVIPKELVVSVLDLENDASFFVNGHKKDDENDTESGQSIDNGLTSLQLLEELRETGLALVRERHPSAYETGDYKLAFHIPPFTSVDHLHLHVLAPASSMSPLYRNGKYHTGHIIAQAQPPAFFVRWCTSLDDVVARLRQKDSPTPYRRDEGWGTTISEAVSSIRSILVSSWSSSQQKRD
jgi:diadenosine tetraphosphate (Ap4A) HIT family hydrolase